MAAAVAAVLVGALLAASAAAARTTPSVPASRAAVCSAFRHTGSSALELGGTPAASVHEELQQLARLVAKDRYPGPAAALALASRLNRVVRCNVVALGSEDVFRIVDVLETLSRPARLGKSMRSCTLRTLAATACGFVTEEQLRKMLLLWDAATWRRQPPPVAVLSSAWHSLEAFAQSGGASSDVLQQVMSRATRLLSTDSFSRPSSLHALRVLKVVISSERNDLETLRIAIDIGHSLVSRYGSECAASAYDTFALATRHLTMNPRFAQSSGRSAELAARSFVLAGRGKNSVRLCPALLSTMTRASRPILSAAPGLRRRGLPVEVVGHIGEFAAEPGAAQTYRMAIVTCARLAHTDEELGTSIALALWRAVCAPSADVGLPAASAFATVANGMPNLWRHIGGGELALVGRCLKLQPGEVPGSAFAEKIAAVVEGTWAHLRNRPASNRKSLQKYLSELCRTVQGHVRIVASVPSVATPAFLGQVSAVCGGIVNKKELRRAMLAHTSQ